MDRGPHRRADVEFEQPEVAPDDVFARVDALPVLAVETPVMALEDVLTTKLRALNEHALDYTQLLGIARSLREQIDWARLQTQTADSPFAKAFFTLVSELGIAPRAGGATHQPPRVRVPGRRGMTAAPHG